MAIEQPPLFHLAAQYCQAAVHRQMVDRVDVNLEDVSKACRQLPATILYVKLGVKTGSKKKNKPKKLFLFKHLQTKSQNQSWL